MQDSQAYCEQLLKEPTSGEIHLFVLQACEALDAVASVRHKATLGGKLVRRVEMEADSELKETMQRALEAFEKFPHFPKAQAAIAVKALRKAATHTQPTGS